VVFVPVWSLPRVTRITGSESVVPDRASSYEQSSSRRPLEPSNMCTCSGNGTQERAVQDLLCLVGLYLVYLI